MQWKWSLKTTVEICHKPKNDRNATVYLEMLFYITWWDWLHALGSCLQFEVQVQGRCPCEDLGLWKKKTLNKYALSLTHKATSFKYFVWNRKHKYANFEIVAPVTVMVIYLQLLLYHPTMPCFGLTPYWSSQDFPEKVSLYYW